MKHPPKVSESYADADAAVEAGEMAGFQHSGPSARKLGGRSVTDHEFALLAPIHESRRL
jgi:hypothetical protein